MGRFLPQDEMGAARHEQAVFNARMKRGEIEKPETIVATRHVVCGCGMPGCIFISAQREEPRVETHLGDPRGSGMPDPGGLY